MSFTNPSFLFGLPATLTPIIIYLLLRRRKTEVPWGASYLLRRTLESKRKSSVWKQYLVLALRCLILALMAALISEPFRTNPEPNFSSPALPLEPVHRVVLIDHSMSMTVSSEAATRMSRMKEALQSLLASQRPGDTMTLISLTHPTKPLVSEALTGNLRKKKIGILLDRIRPREDVLKLQTALARAMNALAATPETRAELYLFSDFPREIAERFSRIEWFQNAAEERGIRIAPVNMSAAAESASGNVSLNGATLGSDLVVAGIPVTLYIHAVNHSDTETVTRIWLTGGGIEKQQKIVVLQANESRRITMNVTFREAGVKALKAAAQPSRLRAAAEAVVSVDVRERLNVWLLAAAPNPTKPDALGEAEFIRRVLAGQASKQNPIELTEIELVQTSRPIPEEIDAILIAGPRVITPTVLEPLTKFVLRGGGLVVALSPLADVSFYNPNFKGLLPATLTSLANLKTDPETFLTAMPFSHDFAPSLLTEFAGAESGELTAARFYNHMLIEDIAPNATVLLKLSDHSPLLVHRGLGRGHVYLFTSSFGISWSSLPVRRSFLPFLNRLLNSAAAGRTFKKNLEPEDSFITRWPNDESVTMRFPDLHQEEVTPVKSLEHRFVVFEKPGRRGPYTLSAASGHQESFTVKGKPAEADLRTLDNVDQKTLETLLDAPLHADWSAAVKALGAEDSLQRFWPLILLIVICVYLFETWFVKLL